MINEASNNPFSSIEMIRMENESDQSYRYIRQLNNGKEKIIKNKDDNKDDKNYRNIIDNKCEKQSVNYDNQQKNFIVGVTLVISQIVICIIHGIIIRPDQQNFLTQRSLQPNTFIIPFILSLGSTLGFGLLFSYNKKLILSGLGYSLFINAYVIQYYPLMNALLSKTHIFQTQQQDFNNLEAFYLSYESSFSTIKNMTYNHIEGCFRCAMAINVAISCVLGRCGLFQVFATILVGVFGYQLNRRICVQNFGDDVFGSLYIFTFGGFMGLGMGIMLRFKDRHQRLTANHINLRSSEFSTVLSLLGCSLLTISLPFLAYNSHTNILNQYQYYSPVLCIILSTSSGFLGGFSVSLINNNKSNIRNFIHGSIAGAIIGGVSSYFTTNLAYCLGVGMIGGVLQVMIQDTIENKLTYRHRIFTTISFSLFGLQGLLASCAGAIGKKIVDNTSPNMSYISVDYNSVKLFQYGLVSSTIGLGFGMLLGLIFYNTHINSKTDYFNDKFNWIVITELNKNIQRTPKPDSLNYQQMPNPTISSDSLSIDPASIVSIPY